MNIIDRLVLAASPQAGLKRMRARRAAEALMSYDIANGGRRTSSTRALSSDADAAGAKRMRAAWSARDMVRNNAIAARAVAAVATNTIGDGIIPSLVTTNRSARDRFLELVARHCDTTAIDADGGSNLYGLQRLVMNAIATDGEVLIRIRRRRLSDGLPLPFQLQLLEADYLDESADITQPSGVTIRDGIEYDALGRRIAYFLYDEHPGSTSRMPRGLMSRRVPASEIIHVRRPDRPGQQRGVSWLAPVAMQLQDLGDYMDAQVVRQKIAACFAAFRITSDDTSGNEAVVPAKLAPGLISTLGPGDDVKFADPPGVDGLDPFMRGVLRAIASGIGITYEALSGDLSNVNFSSARMGRLEMDANVSAWRWLMLRPQMLDPIGALMLDAWAMMEPTRDLRRARVEWTPPAKPIVDPTREIPAMRDAVRAGLRSWQDTIRTLGRDPETVASEIAADGEMFDRLNISIESDARADAQAEQPETATDPLSP